MEPARVQDQEQPCPYCLIPQAKAIIKALPQVVGDEFVFSNRSKGPATGFGDAKKRVDKIMRAKLDRPLLPWVWHDLRRTVVTGMSEIGILPHVVEATVNHVSGVAKKGVAGIYNKASYSLERQQALEAWGRYIDSVIGRGTDNVVTLVRA